MDGNTGGVGEGAGGVGGQKQTAIQHIYPAAAGMQRGIVKTGTGCSRSTAGEAELSLSLRGMFPDLIRIWVLQTFTVKPIINDGIFCHTSPLTSAKQCDFRVTFSDSLSLCGQGGKKRLIVG